MSTQKTPGDPDQLGLETVAAETASRHQERRSAVVNGRDEHDAGAPLQAQGPPGEALCKRRPLALSEIVV